MSVVEQTKYLLYRNYLLKIRNKKETFQELFLPVFFMVLLAGIRSSIPTRDDPAIVRKNIPSYNVLQDFSLFSNNSNSTPKIAFVRNNLERAANIVNVLKGYTKNRVNFIECSTVQQMTDDYRNQKDKFSFGIVFEQSNSSYLGLKYTLLSPYKSQPSTLEKLVPIDRCRNTQQNLLGGFNCPANGYLVHKILAVQVIIDAAFRAVGENMSSVPEPRVTVQMMPKPEFKTNLEGFFVTVAIYFVMAFTPVVSVLLINLVREKELKIKESMKIMGMKTLAFWMSWSIIYMVVVLIVCLIMIAIAVPSKIFGHSNAFCVLIFLYLYGLSLVSMSFMLTPFFRKAKVAGTLASLSTMIFGVMTLPVTLLDVPNSLKWLISLLSPAALTLGLSKGSTLKNGLQFDTLFDSQDSYPGGYSIIMLLVDIILYLILALYFDTVVPGEYGRRKAPYFCFLPSFWKGLLGCSSVDDKIYSATIVANFEDQSDIETIPEELSSKRAIRIYNLRKVFKDMNKEEIVAVNNVSLDIYEGQITALLGHNGAGKTTLLSMLTGLITSTSGTAEIYGNNINNDYGQERIREMTGTCPQQNILFDNLTTYEHLKFYAGVKNIPRGRIEAEIDNLLEEVDLMKEKDNFSKNLSGGQKRKLCLAISLIGDPKIVFLDEPTSGMDPYSRRMVWSLLKRKSKDRVIFMTTHFMDEADILADYKAIMSGGKLRTAGSSLFLKNRFGIGYHLNMTVDESCDVRSMTQLVQSKVSGAELAGEHGKELRYTLPLECVSQFADLFSLLENSNSTGDVCSASELGVKSYGVSMTTLEEVFLKLGEEEELAKADTETEDEQDNEQRLDPEFAINAPQERDNIDMNALKQTYEKNTKNFFVERQQMLALLKIRLLSSMRSKLKIFFHIIMPPCFLLAGLLIARSRSSQSLDLTHKLKLEPGLYLTNAGSASYAAPLLLRNSSRSIHDLVKQFQKRKIRSDVVNSFESLLKNYPHNIAFDSINISPAGLKYSLLYNDSTVHALPLAVSIADSVIVSMLRNVSTIIETYVQAFPSLEEIFKFDSASFNSALLIGIALTIVPGGFTIPVVMLKEYKIQHQLRVSGVSALVYWGSAFVFDFLTMAIPVVLIVILVPALGAKSFLVPGAMGALILALFIYMNLAIVLAYVISFTFSSWQTANNIAPSFFTMFGMLGYLTVSLIDLINYNSNPNLPIILHYVFLIIDPPYSIYGALYFIDRVYRRESVKQLSLDVSPPASEYFTWTKQNGLPAALLIPTVHLVLFTLLLFYLDARSRGKKINWPWRKWCPETSGKLENSSTSEFEEDDDAMVDEDVEAERKRIIGVSFDTSSDSHAVVTKGVWKSFRDQETKKLVIRDLHFAVDSGEVFALLGPNGAGKTTLMNIVTSDLQPDSGKVFVSGIDVSSNTEQAYGFLGFCPQINALMEEITVEEHLHCYARIKGVPPAAIKDLADCFMSCMKIKMHAKKRASSLSGGTKRKLQFGICVLGSPQLLLLDEPSSGLDPKSRRFLWDMIQECVKGDRGAILTTHSMEEAEAVSTRVGIMVKGQMKAIGSTQHLKNRFGTGFMLEVKLSPNSSGSFEELDQYIKENFPGSQISESFGLRASYKVPRNGVAALSKTFAALENGKQLVNIEEYSFSQTTLEQVFLELAREQDEDRTGQSENQTKLERSSSRRSDRGRSLSG